MKLFLCDDTKLKEVARLVLHHECGIEVQSFYHPVALARLSAAVKEHEVVLRGIQNRAMHGPFGDLCPGSFDPMVRSVARNRFDAAADAAKQLDVTHLILHHGYVPGTSKPSGWVSRSTEFWTDYLDSIPTSISVHIENTLDDGPEVILEVVSSVNRSNFDVCLDVGHVNCRSKVKAIAWIKRLGSRLGYVHLHDNHGEDDEHLGLGQGTLPVAEVCHALREHAPNAWWALEAQVPQLESSLRWLSDHGFLT
jgi:sugar phosphate isomerase/epimerase